MGNGGSSVYPAHVLGKSYEERQESEFRKHAESFFRFTYRRNMPAIEPSSITSDSGWGCMLRSAQMLMGHALQRHYLGTEWRMPPDVKASRAKKSKLQALSENKAYCNIAAWFTDYPGWPHIYSLHHLVHCGMSKYDKAAGQWVGPATAAYLLRDLARMHCALHGGSLEVLVTQGDTIYIAEAEAVCTRSEESRAEYIAQLRSQGAHRSNSADSAEEADRPSAVNSSSTMHPLLVPLTSSSGANSQNEATPELGEDTIAMDDSHLADASRISETYDRCSEVGHSIQSGAPLKAPAVQIQSATPTNTNASKTKSNAAATPSKSSNNSEFSFNSPGFFDPLLRPPPKLAAPWSTALLVLVPLMLGIHSVNKEYIEEIKEVLRHRNCVGILGGRPNHAIYFVGYRGDCLLGLDPHTVFPNPPLPPAAATSADHPLAPHVPLDGGGGCGTEHPAAGTDCSRSGYGKQSSGAPRTTSTDSSLRGGSECNKRTRSAGFSWDSVEHRHAGPGALAHNALELGLNTTYSSSSSTSTSTSDSFFSSAFAGFGAYASGSDSTSFPSAEYLSQVHVSEFVTLDFSRLDPSMAIGFYFPGRAEFEQFCEETRLSAARKLREGKYPLYSVQSAAPAFMYSDAQDYGGSSGKKHRGAQTGAEAGDAGIEKCNSFDPADADDLVAAGSAGGASRGVPRAVSAEDSSDEDYVLV